MKTDFSKLPREEVEARITTMLMGQMPDEEARELMDFVSRDPELMRLHAELKATISLVTEASSATEQPHISEARREALLQRFKIVSPSQLQETATPTRNWTHWAAMAAMVGFLVGGTMFVFQASPPTRHMRVALGDQAAEKQRVELLMRRNMESPNSKADSYRSKPLADETVAPAKIELPAFSESDGTAAPKPTQWEFQSGQNERGLVGEASRGYSGGGGGSFGGIIAQKPSEAKLPAGQKDQAGITITTSSIPQERNYAGFGEAVAAGKNFGLSDDQNHVANELGYANRNAPAQDLVTAPPPALQAPAATPAQEPSLGRNDSAQASTVAGRIVDSTEALDSLKRKTEAPVMLGTGLEQQARGEQLAELSKKTENLGQLQQSRDLDRRQSAGRELVQEAEVADKESRQKAALMVEKDFGAKTRSVAAAIPQPEVSTAANAFSTFSLNVSDVSFKLAAASLEKGLMPEAATVRSEEFINAFDYRDPEPQGAPIGFVSERAQYPFAQDRDLVRFSVKTEASGREAGRPLNLVLLLDSSGSMERADRVRILQECLKTLAAQLRPEDTVSVVAFARTARLWVDGLPGSRANELPARVGNLTPEGGTNLEEAMKVAYETARKHFSATGINRVVLLTDGAANLGEVEPESLKKKVEAERTKGIALDCFGIGWEGLKDELLETLSRNGDGRYGFVNTPEAAASEFAGQLAGALHVAASDVKVQVEWNPKRVTAYRQIGYAKHQLTKEQFRDNTVDAAELGAAEAGNALYVVQVNAAGEGPLGTVRVRFKVPGTNDYREHAWTVDYDGASKALENSTYALRLAGTASAFSEWLVSSPYASEVTTDRLLSILSGVPEHFAPDPRPTKLEWMIRQAKSLTGK